MNTHNPTINSISDSVMQLLRDFDKPGRCDGRFQARRMMGMALGELLADWSPRRLEQLVDTAQVAIGLYERIEFPPDSMRYLEALVNDEINRLQNDELYLGPWESTIRMILALFGDIGPRPSVLEMKDLAFSDWDIAVVNCKCCTNPPSLARIEGHHATMRYKYARFVPSQDGLMRTWRRLPDGIYRLNGICRSQEDSARKQPIFIIVSRGHAMPVTQLWVDRVLNCRYGKSNYGSGWTPALSGSPALCAPEVLDELARSSRVVHPKSDGTYPLAPDEVSTSIDLAEVSTGTRSQRPIDFLRRAS